LSRLSSTQRLAKYETEEFFTYPRNVEGDDPIVNWSLQESGVTNAGLAYHNASVSKLLNRLGVKDAKTPIELNNLNVKAAGIAFEAGDNMDHDEFGENLSQVQNYLSEGQEMFVEDLAVGSHPDFRLGVRVVTRRPDIALAAKSVLFPVPPRPIKLNAGCKGWNLGPRHRETVEENMFWDGKQYIDIDNSSPKQGQRPIVVLLGHTAKSLGEDHIATQFVEFQGEIVGATIVASESVSMASLFLTIGNAGAVIINSAHNDAVAVPATTFLKNGKSFVVVNANEAVISAAVAAGANVYGAHFQTLSARGVSALLSGAITEQAAVATPTLDAATSTAVSLKAKGAFFTGLQPDNLTFPASKIIIFDAAGKVDAIKGKETLVEMSDAKKEAVISKLLANAGVSVATTPAQVPSLFV
jgi:uncharacterized protein YlzI (FlbEa/FlbD family)